MLENRWAREYLNALGESRNQVLGDIPEFVASFGITNFEDLMMEIRAARQGGSRKDGENLAVAALALCAQDSPASLVPNDKNSTEEAKKPSRFVWDADNPILFVDPETGKTLPPGVMPKKDDKK